MKRTTDILISFFLLILLILPMLVVFITIRLESSGPALFWSERIGKNNKSFMMPKFRTMHTGTVAVATHLLENPDSHLTRIGNLLRRTSVDELPQLFSILRGHMTLVGPRPALFNQFDLIELRTNSKVHTLLPGVTGWAQVNGRDNITVEEKVNLDIEYYKNKSIRLDIHIIFLTLLKVIRKEGISH
jgi:O-antigen biosynthesis protein WbqP|tara:strand:- start:53 stop:613 length:561 start_codon:yes stop_codon:yes gene_type:complete